MAERSETPLFQRRCRAEGCGTVFWICRSCDRGQRYCCPTCREVQRGRQLRAANRRHQRSREGQLDHRDRQRAYRWRTRSKASVTDQGRRPASRSCSIGAPATPPTISSTSRARLPVEKLHHVLSSKRSNRPFYRHHQVVCRICGHGSAWFSPFGRDG